MSNFIFFAFLLTLSCLALDFAFFRYRRKKFDAGQPLNETIQRGLEQAMAGIRARWERLPKLFPAFELPAAAPDVPPLPPADSAPTGEPASQAASAPVAEPAPQAEPARPAEACQEQPPVSVTSVPAGTEKTVHIQFSADIPEGTVVNITLEVQAGQGKSTLRRVPVGQNTILPQPTKQNAILPHSIRQWLTARAVQFGVLSPERLLLIGSILMYALVVSIGIGRFPIYFFTDEAIHMNLAADFLRDGFQNYYNEFLPTFFSVEGWVNGTSVYVQVLPYLLFGKSVVATRLVSAFITLLGATALGLMLKQAFKVKYYWAAIFLLLTTPAWFLHARTAFEYAEVGSFYAIFLYFYSRYRAGDLPYLYAAVVAGALTFYTHGLGQILMSVTGLGLFIVDFRYHLHPDRRKTVLYGFGLALILLLPFARYYLAHPMEAAAQVKRRGSYWTDGNLTFIQKLGEFFYQYIFYGLNPRYWYFPNGIDLNRHIMRGYNNGLLFTLPFAIWGFILSIKRMIRQPVYRAALIAFLAAPIPASVVAVGMPRMLWMSVPLAIFTTLGLVSILQWLEARWASLSRWMAWGLFAVLTSLSLFMLRDALVSGPLWFQDYGLYGMQYGAQQIFGDTVVPALEKDPTLNIVISPSWANGTEQFTAFFIPPKLQSRIRFGQPIDLINNSGEFSGNTLFVATSDEYNKLVNDPKFKDISVQSIIPYPNEQPGFYVLTLLPSDNIQEVLAAQHEVNRAPVEDVTQINGQDVTILHSPFGSGQLSNIFDDDPDTLARVLEANPFVFDLYPPTPLNTNSVTIQTGSLPDFTVTILLYAPGATDPVTYSQTFRGLPSDPLVTLDFEEGPAQSERIYIEIKDNLSEETSQIHVRTIQFK
jgi:hypothetical protein